MGAINDNASATSAGMLLVENAPFLEGLTRSLPAPLAHSVAACLRDPRPEAFFFSSEAALRYVSMIVKSAYLQGSGAPLRAVNDAIRRKTLHPAMGSWAGFLEASLPHLINEDIRPPFPETVAVVQHLVGEDVRRTVKLRNDAHGHAGAVLPAEVTAAVMAAVVPLWLRLMRAMEILGSYPLYVFDERVDAWQLCMGTVVCATEYSSRNGVDCAGLLRVGDAVEFPLFPLVVCTFDGFIPALPPHKEGPRSRGQQHA